MIKEFDESVEDFASYVERFEMWASANEVADYRRACTFLASVGPAAYQILKNLCSPDLPKDKNYEEIKDILSMHYTPKPIVIAERFRFHRRNQTKEESISQYIVELKKLSATCEFGTFLEEALRDRLVCGLQEAIIQRRLLAEKNLTFKQACEICHAMEMAMKNTRELTNEVEGQVNKVGEYSGKKREPSVEKGKEAEEKRRCFRCGGAHAAHVCKFKDAKCYKCQRFGHIASRCGSAKRSGNANSVEEEKEVEEEVVPVFVLNPDKALKVKMILNGHDVLMLLDTGASVSIISEVLYNRLFKHFPLTRVPMILKTYSGEVLTLKGRFQVPVRYNGQEATLPLVVVAGEKPALLGRNWMRILKLDWGSLFAITGEKNIEEIVKSHEAVFKNQGTIKDVKVSVQLEENAKPVFHRARPVPYALKAKVEAELDRLERQGVISKVNYSEWAAPIVVVPKADSSVRICGDYKVTINPMLKVDQHPLPNAQDLFATLAGGKWFSKLDLSHAYQQLELDDASKKYLTINTSQGLYQYHRLTFGIASAPAIFQNVMDKVLQGLVHVVWFLDDILIATSSVEEHLEVLNEVLSRLEKFGIGLKREKCKFLEQRVEYLGHCVDSQGLHPTDEKVTAIIQAPRPSNVSELRSYLGLLNYYGKFLGNLASTLHPLHQLLKKDSAWSWTEECEKAFQGTKKQLMSSQVLVHYDPKKKLVLACDASAYGIGAVISHVMDNGDERPIAFASRTLSDSERNYAQLEKEALAIIFGVKKFHQFLYGRKFTLITDHKPLTTILGPKSAVPPLAAARLQRWALILSAYTYEIQYRRSENHANADAMSRLPQETTQPSTDEQVYQFTLIDELPVTASDIAAEVRRDPVLGKVLDFTLNGWPERINDKALEAFHIRRHELSTEQGCVLWGLRVIIPEKFRNRMLDELHEEHPGICRMKALARSHLWWPSLDQEIEEKVRGCSVCLSVRKMPALAPLHPWAWPRQPWHRIHVDFAEKDGKNFLVVVDSHSKWPEVILMGSTTSAKTIEVLRGLFATWGIPKELVSDNGPQLISEEMERFLRENGVKHILSAPYHPATNGAAENSVQTLKNALKKQLLDVKTSTLSLQHRLARFLLSYRTTPHTVTGQPPAELFLKRTLRTRLSMVKPDLAKVVEQKQGKQKFHHDKRAKGRMFQPKDRVLVRNFRGGKDDKWIAGIVVRKKGPVNYLVRVNGKIRFVHVDHLLEASSSEKIVSNDAVNRFMSNTPLSNVLVPNVPSLSNEVEKSLVPVVPSSVDMSNNKSHDEAKSPVLVNTPKTPNPLVRRYPTRERSAPKRLIDEC